MSSRTDANGKTTQYGYDPLGRLTSVTDALSQVTSYAYDEVGNRISQTDAKGHTTAFQFDSLGRRVGRTLPAGQSESFTYDANGNLHTHTDFNGKTTTYTYNAGNHLTSKIPDPSFSEPTVTYSYDGRGLRQFMFDAIGTTQYLRDGQGRIFEERSNTADNLYSYDGMGNLATLGSLTYTYDALNRLSSVRDSNMGTVTYAYDAVGNLSSRTLPNGVVQTYAYDSKNRLTGTAAAGGAGANPANLSYAYTLDSAGHRTSVTEASGRQVHYTYDDLYRLTNETIQSDPAGKSGSIAYAYDPVGNRTQQTSTSPAVTSGTFGYDADDRLSSDVYDANGNTTNSGGQGITYDFENHILTENGAVYAYDGDGNRVIKSVGGLNTIYAIVSINPTGYPQVGYEQYSGFGAHDNFRVWLLGLDREAQYRSFVANGSQTSQLSYYLYDGHGSVRALSDPSGNVTDTYDYDAFGNLISSSTTLASPTPNEFLFAGEQFDAETGHYYLRARYLNTSTGRFISQDPYEGKGEEPGSLHRYLYVADSPVDRIDPSGNQEISLGATAFAISIAFSIVALGSLGFKYYIDSADANVQGVAAQEAAEPMAAAAITTLEDGAHTALFQRYFGPPLPSQVNLVTSNYEGIVNALAQKISFYHVYTFSNEYAEAIPHGPLNIGLGPFFFKAPPFGRDSKAGTIIHELSHIVDGTRDYSYGVQAALSLPSDQAANNADTYEYYAEDSYTILYGSGPQ